MDTLFWIWIYCGFATCLITYAKIQSTGGFAWGLIVEEVRKDTNIPEDMALIIFFTFAFCLGIIIFPILVLQLFIKK